MTLPAAGGSVADAMRIPTRSEQDAFRLTIGGAALIVVSVLVGWLGSPLAGVVVFVAGLLGAGVAYLRAPNPDRHTPLRDAARAPHPHGAAPGVRHVLVLANDALAGERLRELIVGADGRPVEVDVLAPVLTSHVHLTVTDIDHELAQARARLERSLAWAREQGLVARGTVGDSSLTSSIADQLRDFGAEEVIVVTHPSERETWQERDELERLRGELDIPVTHVVAPEGDRAAEPPTPAP